MAAAVPAVMVHDGGGARGVGGVGAVAGCAGGETAHFDVLWKRREIGGVVSGRRGVVGNTV